MASLLYLFIRLKLGSKYRHEFIFLKQLLISTQTQTTAATTMLLCLISHLNDEWSFRKRREFYQAKLVLWMMKLGARHIDCLRSLICTCKQVAARQDENGRANKSESGKQVCSSANPFHFISMSQLNVVVAVVSCELWAVRFTLSQGFRWGWSLFPSTLAFNLNRNEMEAIVWLSGERKRKRKIAHILLGNKAPTWWICRLFLRRHHHHHHHHHRIIARHDPLKARQ